MENTAKDERPMEAIEDIAEEYHECEVLEFDRDFYRRDSLSENFINEIEAWARHAFGANGFGDY